jgi:hypothetical protein
MEEYEERKNGGAIKQNLEMIQTKGDILWP